MKRSFIIGFCLVILSGCSLLPQKAGIEVMSYPTAKLYIDNKEAGTTPYKNNNLTPGKINLRLVTETTNWEKDIDLVNGVNTVINRTLKSTDSGNGGYVLTLESTGDDESSQLMVNSSPDRAAISVNGEMVGLSPLRVKDFGEGEKQITISSPRFKSITILIRAIKGFQTVIDADLENEDSSVILKNETNNELITPTMTNKQVKILSTETGWLRVRGQPNGQSAEIKKVNPGEIFTIISEESGYIEIDIGNGQSGWILAKYAEKL